MENTIGNKAKFFAQYVGQKVFKYSDSGPHEKWNFYSHSASEYLLLKPISHITEAELREVANIFTESQQSEYVMDEYETLEFLSECTFIMHQVIDYLRSRGYLVPFHNLTCEELISYGWCKTI